MLVERFYTPGLAQVAYIVADPARRAAAVIDPRRDVGEYLTWTLDHGGEIVAILATHVHADFVSGALELAAATGAPICAGRLGESTFPHRPLSPSGFARVMASAARCDAAIILSAVPQRKCHYETAGELAESRVLKNETMPEQIFRRQIYQYNTFTMTPYRGTKDLGSTSRTFVIPEIVCSSG